MKHFTCTFLLRVLLAGWLLASCSPKAVLPVSDPAKVKPLTEAEQLEKQFYFSEAMKAYELHDWPMANRLFKKAIAIDAGCDACFYQLANIYYQSGYLYAALSLNASAVQLDTANFWYRMQAAQYNATARQYGRAIEEYNYLLQKRPDMPDLYFDLSALYVRMGALDSALLLLDDADAKTGYSEQSAATRFEILTAQKKKEEALSTLERLVTAFPEARYFSLLGEQYAALERDTLALEMYRQALALNPDYTPALLGEADCFRRNGHFDTYFQKLYNLYANQAVETEYKVEYLSAILQIPKFASSFSPQLDTVFTVLRTPPDSLTEPLYATYLLQKQLVDSAITVLKNHLQNNIGQLDAWQRYLAVEYYAEQWDTLGKYAEIAHRRFPGEVDFMSMKAIAAWQTGDGAEAIRWFEKTLPLTVDEPKKTVQTYAFLGDLYYAEKNPKKAYQYYEKALAIDGDYIVALNNYAYFLSEENKRLDRAYTMSNKAIKAEPNNATYLDTFGWILFKMGKAVEAKAIFRHAMIYGGNDSAVILDHYGDVLHALGEYDAAVVYWDLSLKKEPNTQVEQKIKNSKR
ncbi:MAG: tetratricopeptide repeat protein [Prevotellaceae bacterium]|jgi:tetratricopeptide (TPR) repeat protein|nr:tetratricopeptide repeat protein [Prevotellaceae bacterium]